jgi:molybdopterin biosynthesis enzyme MoaB
MTVKVTLTATRIVTVDKTKYEGKSPDEIGDMLADEVQENPAKFVSDVNTTVEIAAEVELSPEP